MVSSSNDVALRMYEHLGFENRGMCEWDKDFYILRFYIDRLKGRDE